MSCLGLEAGRQRRDGQRADLGGVVRVGVDLLAGERVSCIVLVWCSKRHIPGQHAPDALVGGAVVVEPTLVLLVVPAVVVETLVVVPGVVVLVADEDPLVVVGLTLVTKVVVVVALPG